MDLVFKWNTELRIWMFRYCGDVNLWNWIVNNDVIDKMLWIKFKKKIKLSIDEDIRLYKQ